ncbi:SLOG family protein, partial [Leuconostoc mesenteroides]|uniref:SLOG family protein n=1 Tax=Leuconostoc mesenteroides TaxID=1245 RepID=UPI001EE3B41B
MARPFLIEENIMRLWVTGYRSYELGTFGDKDPKIKVIKYALHQTLKEQVDNG